MTRLDPYSISTSRRCATTARSAGCEGSEGQEETLGSAPLAAHLRSVLTGAPGSEVPYRGLNP